jgi:hypothetical protein
MTNKKMTNKSVKNKKMKNKKTLKKGMRKRTQLALTLGAIGALYTSFLGAKKAIEYKNKIDYQTFTVLKDNIRYKIELLSNNIYNNRNTLDDELKELKELKNKYEKYETEIIRARHGLFNIATLTNSNPTRRNGITQNNVALEYSKLLASHPMKNKFIIEQLLNNLNKDDINLEDI